MKIEIASAISQIVESMLPRFSEDKMLVMTIDVSYEEFDERFDVKANRFSIHFAFSRPGNYTKVLFGTSERSWSIEAGMELSHTSDHDSCWRSDGVESPLRKIHWEECDKLLNQIEEQCGKEVRDSLHRYMYSGGQPHFITFQELKVVSGRVERNRSRGSLSPYGAYLVKIEDDEYIFEEQPVIEKEEA